MVLRQTGELRNAGQGGGVTAAALALLRLHASPTPYTGSANKRIDLTAANRGLKATIDRGCKSYADRSLAELRQRSRRVA